MGAKRSYPRNAQQRVANAANPAFPLTGGAGKHGPRNVQSAHDAFLNTRPDTNTTAVASTIWGY
jgi:hypothetical protein